MKTLRPSRSGWTELLARREELWELLAPENLEAGRIDELYDQQQKARSTSGSWPI